MGCCDETETRRVIRKVHLGHGHGGHMLHGHHGGPMVTVICDCGCGGHSGHHEYTAEDELKDLEEVQRDLEQEVANIADRIKDLREEIEKGEAEDDE